MGWSFSQYLTVSDPLNGSWYGNTAKVYGDYAVVACPRDNDRLGGFKQGSAYVFHRDGAGVWSQFQKLTPAAPDWTNELYFSVGVSAPMSTSGVAIYGTTIVVGANGYNGGIGAYTGAAFVFVLSGGVWVQQQKLVASDAAAYDNAGFAVAIYEDTIIIGAYGDDNAKGSNAGAAYIWTRAGGVWTEQAKLIPTDAGVNNYVGRTVAICADRVCLSSARPTGVGSGSGAAYTFTRSGAVWTQEQKLTDPDGLDKGNAFGSDIALLDTKLAIGAIQYPTTGGADSGKGKVELFDLVGPTWTHDVRLTATGWVPGDNPSMGASISYLPDGSMLVAGAPYHDGAGFDSGCAKIFTKSGGVWSAPVTVLLGAPWWDQGHGVALYAANELLVGAPQSGGTTGRAFVWVNNAAPVISNQSPPDLAIGQSGGVPVSFDVADLDGNLDPTTVSITIEGVVIYSSEVAISGWSVSRNAITNGFHYVVYGPGYHSQATINVTVYAEDIDTLNVSGSWSFTMQSDVHIGEGGGGGGGGGPGWGISGAWWGGGGVIVIAKDILLVNFSNRIVSDENLFDILNYEILSDTGGVVTAKVIRVLRTYFRATTSVFFHVKYLEWGNRYRFNIESNKIFDEIGKPLAAQSVVWLMQRTKVDSMISFFQRLYNNKIGDFSSMRLLVQAIAMSDEIIGGFDQENSTAP